MAQKSHCQQKRQYLENRKRFQNDGIGFFNCSLNLMHLSENHKIIFFELDKKKNSTSKQVSISHCGQFNYNPFLVLITRFFFVSFECVHCHRDMSYH